MARPTPLPQTSYCPTPDTDAHAVVATGTVDDVMVRAPRVWGCATSVADARRALDDDHLHALLIVEHGALLAVLERRDLHDADPALPASAVGRLAGRLVGPTADAEATRLQMLDATRRRLAVVDDTGALLGLLCLKRSGLGFCSDADVAARVAGRARAGPR